MVTAARKASKGPAAPIGPKRYSGDAVAIGKPLQLPLAVIDEDPDQPRTQDNPGFSPARLSELAETIRTRGVKTPISVRNHPLQPGRYLINHGARRYRASKMAGVATIPAFIDNDYGDADQVIENLQRNELTAREIADYIGRQLAKGMKKAEIAKSIGKSAAFVTQHVTLLDLPAPIANAFSSGRARDVTVISELVKAYKSNSAAVTEWLRDEAQEITRGAVATLREFLDAKAAFVPKRALEIVTGDDDAASAYEGDGTSPDGQGEARFARRPLAVHVLYKKQSAILLHQRKPSAEGLGWIRLTKDAAEIEVPLESLRLKAVKERES